MSAKWRSLQHRHKYTYTSVVFPKSSTEVLDLIASDSSSSSSFFTEVKHFASLNSTYAQLDEVKKLASSFSSLLADPHVSGETISTAARFYLEIFFLENSLPLHRTLISALNKCRKFHHVISTCFAKLCEEYGNLGKKEKKRFLVSRATLSLIGYPKLGILDEIVEKCYDRVAMDVIFGLESVLLDISSGARPSPVVMEQCQDAMSCMYYLLQRYPSKFVSSENSSNIFRTSLSTILSVLNSSFFSRDCLIASAVSFCAAIQAFMGPAELSTFIFSKLFRGFSDKNYNGSICYPDLIKGTSDLSVLSRLCLLRGILTATPREVLNSDVGGSVNASPWTILYSGILPELCYYCENPVDSHFNFHALTVTQICLQQIKTSLLSGLTNFSNGYEPFSEEVKARLLRIIWNNLEDSLSQTVKQVHLIFDLLLDIESSLPSSKDNGTTKSFLCKIAQDLLCLGPRCKGRYVPLASLTRRLGANSLLKLNSNILFETAYAYIDDDVCCASTSFLKCFLEILRDECWSEFGIEKGYEAFRGLSLPPLMQGLVSGHSKLRTNLNTYALPAVLDVDVDSIFPMLEFISIGPGMRETKMKPDLKLDQCVAALVSLLKVSRTMALIEGDIDSDPFDSDHTAIILVKGVNVRVPVGWFVLSLMHSDNTVRIDAAESLFLNPKTSSLPSALELDLLRKVVPLNMRCSSTAFQMKWTSLFRKFFSRVRTALGRQVGTSPAAFFLSFPYFFFFEREMEHTDTIAEIIN
jgi:thyroid adenoma-associated protein